MKIELAEDPVRVQGPDVEFTLADDGGAHVFIILSVDGVDAFEHAEANQGSKSRVFQLEVGKTYTAGVFISAHAHQALNRKYDTEVSANGQPIAWAEGAIAKDQMSDREFKSFEITVVV